MASSESGGAVGAAKLLNKVWQISFWPQALFSSFPKIVMNGLDFSNFQNPLWYKERTSLSNIFLVLLLLEFTPNQYYGSI